MREPSYNNLSNSLLHGKSDKMIKKKERLNVVNEDKCKATPKDVGGEGTSYQKVRPRLPRVRDYDNLKKKDLRNLFSY